MSRAEELQEIFKGIDESKRKIVSPLIDEAVFLEVQMQELKKHPLLRVHPNRPEVQKVTAAGKMYREYLQTYVNLIDKLCRIHGREDAEEDSPLRAFLKGLEVR